MSVFDENIHPATPERQIDLLVDGELSEADRRRCSCNWSTSPTAGVAVPWRSWKPSAGKRNWARLPRRGAEAARGAGLAGCAGSRRLAHGRRQSWRQYAATTLTMAASFLIALVVGMGCVETGPAFRRIRPIRR